MPIQHALDPLLNPGSVALVGVSERPGSLGKRVLSTFLRSGFEGELYLVNPRYDELAGRPCYHDLADLPAVPEMAILNVGSARMGALFDRAIALGIPALTIFDYCVLEDDEDPDLLARLRDKAARAGVLVCGGGGMGYYNLDAGVHASYYDADHLVPGHISLITHSGSVFTVLAMTDPRYRFNLVVSAGTEIATGIDAYLDYALDMPSTRVVALFIETVRNPAGFMRALERAESRDIPVVVCKVGKTQRSAAFAHTHSGAIAGNQAAFEALFDRYGVLQADSLDEMMATAALMAQGRRAGPGGVGAILDSGGLRQLLVDRAARAGVRFAELSPRTVKEIERHLPHTLVADNPLDAAGPFTYDYVAVFKNCLHAIMEDPDTALGWFEFDATDRFNAFPPQVLTAKSVMHATEKPFVVVNSSSATPNTQLAVQLLEEDIPLINGVDAALVAVRNLLAYRDHRNRGDRSAPQLPNAPFVEEWRECLAGGDRLSEVQALGLLRDFGVPTVKCLGADSVERMVEKAEAIGYPLALKTAVTDISHKTNVGGVRLHIADEEELHVAYHDFHTRLGPEVTVAAMSPGGAEIAFGMIRDQQFGPLVIVSAGGTLIELLGDRVSMLAPVNEREALRHIEKLAIFPLLADARGADAVNMDALVRALVRFSVLAACLGDSIAEIDVNPLVVNAEGLVAVDALIVPTAAKS